MRKSLTGRLNGLVSFIVFFVLSVFCLGTELIAAENSDDYLSTDGSLIYDGAGNPVRLTGIAWFGFETQNQVYHGLWSVRMEDVLDRVANLGFNVLRIPLSVQLVNQWRNGDGALPNSVNYSANPNLEGMTSLQILDASIAYCKQIGLKVMLDMHRVVNTQMLNTWYTDGYPSSDFEAAWQWLAQHYVNDDTIIAVDLFNEPHGQPGDAGMAKWDSSTDQNNWKYEAQKVANLVLDVNPGLLVVIEGIEATPKEGYTYAETASANYDFNWWGGNLRRVKDYPIDLGSRQNQVVYSPHDYGPGVYAQPWFHSGFTKATLTAECWEPNWLYIATQGLSPILVGEWGGRMDGGDNEKWMGALAETIVQYDLNHTFWCVNPNSGDTGGILQDDWQTVDTAKYNLVEPTLWKDANGKYIGLDHLVDLGANGTHVGAATIPGDGEVPVVGVSVTPMSVTLEVGASTTLSATLAPGNASNTNLSWASSNGNLATVSASGVVTALSAGNVTITVTTLDGGYTATSTVTVVETGGGQAPTPCDSPTLAILPLVIDGEGEFCRVTAGDITNINSWNMQLVEINGVDYSNTWSNQMPSRIDGNYYIHYVGQYPWSHLEVNGSGGTTQTIPVTGVTLSPASTSIGVGDTTTLSANVSPADANNRNLTWNSSNTSVATVDSAGVVTGVSVGSASITATTQDGGFTAVSEITVNGVAANYTLNIAVIGNGTTVPSVGPHAYAADTPVSVTATAATGATFTGWSGAATGTTNPISVTMDGNKSLIANFSGGDDALPDVCPGPCNSATPVYPTLISDGGLGNVTMYSTSASSGGACNYGTTDVIYYAAINVNVNPGDGAGQWQGGTICGQCAEVTVVTSQGPRSVVARIMDKCPDDHCGIDLGGDSSATVMLDGSGRYQGKWRFVSCDGHPEVSDGSPSLYVFAGSNPWWSRVHVRNGPTATERITWQDASGTASGVLPFAGDPENSFEVPVNEVLQSGMSSVLIGVHYVDGTSATLTLTPAELAAGSSSYPLN